MMESLTYQCEQRCNEKIEKYFILLSLGKIYGRFGKGLLPPPSST